MISWILRTYPVQILLDILRLVLIRVPVRVPEHKLGTGAYHHSVYNSIDEIDIV